MYKGLPAKTMGVHHTVRVNIHGQSTVKIAEVSKPPACRAHQFTGGRVWAYVADPNYSCCKTNNCLSHFDPLDHRISEARAPLFEIGLTAPQRRQKLLQNWKDLQIVGKKGKAVQVCVQAACKVFGVSKSYLYPSTKGSGVTRAEANMLRSKKKGAIATWLEDAKILMDAMPDDGTFICHHPTRQELYNQYILDARDDTSGTLYKCHVDYFLATLRDSFQEIRMRKHCRFAKCDFCGEWKGKMHDQSVGAALRAEARARYTAHVEWAHIRERGFYHSKRLQADKEPDKYMSIALDGTDQFPYGFPHFRQKQKNDGTGLRVKVHTQIAMVHGRPPMVFVATEDILGDPNLTIECLNRVFKREEQQRPNGLPETLYLELDNCFRENKNTFTFAFLVWIIERGVFKEIFVSFLPVGHTHFDPDQFASRISIAVKDIDVTTIEQYVKILRKCYTAKAASAVEPIQVTVIEDVLDHRALFNPTLDSTFPKATARCDALRGVGTKSLPNATSSWFMGPTTPLHWRLRLDLEHQVIIQSKHTVDDPHWSNIQYIWNTQAPRPEGRVVVGKTSGLLPTDLQLAPSRELKPTRRVELANMIEKIRSRMTNPDEWKELVNILSRVGNPRGRRACPDAVIQFSGDMCDSSFRRRCNPEDSEEEEHSEEPVIEIPRTSMWPNLSTQNAARSLRTALGFSANNLVVGHYVAYVGEYTNDTKEEEKQESWIGAILRLAHNDDENDNTVEIKRWHTNKLDNMSSSVNPTYGPWPHSTKHPAIEWIDPQRILFQFPKLTKGKRVHQKYRTPILAAITCRELDKHQPTDPATMGLGPEQNAPNKRRRMDVNNE